MRATRFSKRWLQSAGLSESQIQERLPRAYQRSRRYNFPINWLYPLVLLTVEWLTPFFFLGKFSRASALSEADFERLEQKLHHNRFLTVRMLYSLIRLPLWGQLSPESKPQAKQKHPLTKVCQSFPEKYPECFDTAIIGSGAGGAPLAWSLSRAGQKVAVIESGCLTEPSTTPQALEYYYLKQAMTLSMKRGLIPIFLGDTVGGTTSINSGTCLPPRVEQLKLWDQQLGTQFAEGALQPYLEIVDQALGVTVPPKELLGPSAALFEKGLQALGREGAYVLPRNAPLCEGSGRCCFVCPTGSKQGTDLAFLPDAVEHGAVLFAETRAQTIKENSGKVYITIQNKNKKYSIKANRLILAAGAIGTPALIRHNCLGSHWRQAGRHLRIHPASKVFAYFSKPVHGDQGVPQGMGYRPPELPRVVLEGIFTPKTAAGPLIAAAGQRHRWWMDRYEHLASFGMMLVERSEGRLWDFASWPVLRYGMQDEDVRDLSASLLLIAEAFFAAGAERILLPGLGVENEFDSLEQIKKLNAQDYRQRDFVISGFHPQGTAALGNLLDLDFRLKGTENIYACDASTLPASPGVNPQVTIMALALKLADQLKGNHP